jgi:putative peptidoglycan lipid II flippase
MFYIITAKLVQFTKELFVAKEIGISVELDSFIISLMLAGIGINTLIIPLGLATMPIFLKHREGSIRKSNSFFNFVLAISLFLMMTVGAFLFYHAEIVVSVFGGNVDTDTKEQAVRYTRLLLPYFFFTVFSVLFGTYLNSLNRNFLYSVYQAFPALATILFFLVSTNEPIYNQVYGYNFGAFIAASLIFRQCWKEGYRFHFDSGLYESVLKVFSQWIPLIFASLIGASNTIVDRVMVSGFGEGSISTLDYGNKIFSIFSSIAVTGVSVVFYPKLSKLANRGAYSEIWTLIKSCLLVVLVPSLVLVYFTIDNSVDLVRLLFERGEFTNENTHEVATVLCYYVVCIPVYVFGIIGVRLLNALLWNYIVALYGIINLLLNILLNYYFMKQIGLAGVALSTSVVVVVNAILIWTTLHIRLINTDFTPRH